MWRKLLDHLNGKELTSAGHLTAQNFSFSDEILIENGKLNFYVQADFDVDAAFGTFVCTDENNDWLNIYANYDIAQDRPCDTLELNLCKGELELSPECCRAGGTGSENGGVLPAAKRHESVRFCPTASRGAGAVSTDTNVAPCLPLWAGLWPRRGAGG